MGAKSRIRIGMHGAVPILKFNERIETGGDISDRCIDGREYEWEQDVSLDGGRLVLRARPDERTSGNGLRVALIPWRIGSSVQHLRSKSRSPPMRSTSLVSGAVHTGMYSRSM